MIQSKIANTHRLAATVMNGVKNGKLYAQHGGPATAVKNVTPRDLPSLTISFTAVR